MTTVSAGGRWLLEPPSTITTPESLSEDQRLIARTAAEFATREVLPAIPALERKDWNLSRDLLRRCGELGFLGVDVPDKYGGVGLDKVSSLIVSQEVARSASFASTFGAQANLCILPLVMFGTPDQKQRYLPRLVTAELTGAYALSESGAGSDAMGIRTTAVRQADGSFRLSGEKMWITNGGMADVAIVFAKVDGEHFSAFIVERAFGGVTAGPEEHKMGLHGCSTTALVLQDVPVPAANLLGEIGRGHKIAFSVLNFGRLKLGAMCLGGCRLGIGESARYAGERRQFGKTIATFGAIRHKLGEMIARTYALEALVFRTAGEIDRRLAETGTNGSALPTLLEDLAVEGSIAKVCGSETLDFVLDENVQIHGGNGYVSDYPAERHFRDARVNRIFEGTNEINRLLIPGILARRAVKGDLPLIPAARRLLDEVMAPSAPAPERVEPLAAERAAVEAFKKVALVSLGLAMQQFGTSLADEQEALTWIADIVIDTYASESALARAQAAGGQARGLHEAAAMTFIAEAAFRIEIAARQLLARVSRGDALRTHLAALRRLLKIVPASTVDAFRMLAVQAVERGDYLF